MKLRQKLLIRQRGSRYAFRQLEIVSATGRTRFSSSGERKNGRRKGQWTRPPKVSLFDAQSLYENYRRRFMVFDCIGRMQQATTSILRGLAVGRLRRGCLISFLAWRRWR